MSPSRTSITVRSGKSGTRASCADEVRAGQSFGNYHLLSLRKANKEDASDNARSKVLPELCRVATEWVKDNQHLVQQREEEIKREKIVSLRHRLSTMLAEADMLRDEIARLEGTPAAIVALS